jgi:hypothetical protein
MLKNSTLGYSGLYHEVNSTSNNYELKNLFNLSKVSVEDESVFPTWMNALERP